MRYRAVFFDMDGVLYDSMPLHETSWTGTFAAEGIEFEARDAYLNEGRTGKGTINLVFNKVYGRDASEEDVERIYGRKSEIMRQLGKAPQIDGMAHLIEFLRGEGVDCYVVTGSKQPTLMERLKGDYGFERDHIVCALDVKKGKPDPEPYLIAWERAAVEKGGCLVVENAPLGVLSAKAADIECWAINTGKLTDGDLLEAGADRIFAKANEIEKEIKKG